MITMNEYQVAAVGSAEYPDIGKNLIYPALGLAGETGEAVDKIKKLWRNHGITSADGLTTEQKMELAKEIGDVLWYAAALCGELGLPMGLVAKMNLEKLADRKARGVIKSEGDNR
jgi:NTP pyrophosphatase (non-canonical NTP hydrolase)